MRFTFATLLFCFLLCSPAFAGPYLWPLEENFGVSGTFGESRDDHFHAGIDLSTNGETGLPVMVIADGIIGRLKIQKRGYGRAIYVQHPDGITSVYAHLESFSDELGMEQTYQRRVKEKGTPYVGDIFLEPPITVKKGDVIAYSGESGAGLPHLHLELRRNGTIAINPLISGFQDSLDPLPPTFQACYLYPLTADSSVDGNVETEELRLRKEDLYYTPDHTPVVRGDFLVSVSVYDAALRPYHRAPFSITLSIDNQTVYSIQFDEISYIQPGPFGLVYDLGKPGPSYYEYPVLLSNVAKISAPFVSRSVPFSTRSLAPGFHQLQIQAADANNNISLAQIRFIVNDPPSIRILDVSEDEKDMIVNIRITDPNWKTAGIGSLAGELEYSTDEGKTFLPFPIARLNLESSTDLVHFSYRLPLRQINPKSVKRVLVKARGFDGVEYSPYSVIAVLPDPVRQMERPPLPSEGKVEVVTYSNAIKVIFDTKELITYPIQVRTTASTAVYEMQSRDLTAYEAIIPAPKVNEKLSLVLSGNQEISLPVHYIQASIPAQIETDHYKLVFGPDSLYWSTFVWEKSLPAYRARYLPVMAPILQIGPRGVPLGRNASVIFRYPKEIERPERLSIYMWDRANQKWKSQPSPVDPSTRTVQTKMAAFDLFALIYDNVPPVITPVFPKRRSTTSNPTPKLVAGIRDTGMDVDDEKILFYVDGKPYVAEYDPDRNLAAAKINQPLRKGYHQFWVVAYDYGGNKTQSTKITFRVR